MKSALRMKTGKAVLAVLVVLSVACPMGRTCSAARLYSLGDVYKVALEQAEKVKISGEDVTISEKNKDKAVSTLLPRLTAYYNFAKFSDEKYSASNNLIQPGDSSNWGVRLDYSLSLSGREFTGLTIARDGIEKSRFDYDSVRESYLMTVSQAYYDVLRLTKTLAIVQANVDRLTKYRAAADARLKAGEVTKTALFRAEAELAGAKSELVKARNQLQLSKVILAKVAGLEGDFELKEGENDPYTVMGESTDLAMLKQLAFSERAELKAAEQQKKISEQQAGYARGAYWPTIGVEGGYLGKDENPQSASLNKESIYGIMKLNFPFYEGGLRRAEVGEALARLRQAQLAYEDAKKTINTEVEGAWLDFITQKEVISSLESQYSFAKDNFNAVTRQFENGLATSVDVMDANSLLVTAERELSNARNGYYLAIIRIKRTTGTLLKTAVPSATR